MISKQTTFAAAVSNLFYHGRLDGLFSSQVMTESEFKPFDVSSDVSVFASEC